MPGSQRCHQKSYKVFFTHHKQYFWLFKFFIFKVTFRHCLCLNVETMCIYYNNGKHISKYDYNNFLVVHEDTNKSFLSGPKLVLDRNHRYRNFSRKGYQQLRSKLSINTAIRPLWKRTIGALKLAWMGTAGRKLAQLSAAGRGNVRDVRFYFKSFLLLHYFNRRS